MLSIRPQGSTPPQIEAVTSHTRLVTMTIGGNDVNYIGTAIECGQPNSTCTATANPAQIDAAFQALPHALTDLIQAIRTKAPSAIIVLVTYPRLVPPTACPALHYTPAATRLVGSMGQRLEQVFVTVAKTDHVSTRGPLRHRSDTWALCHGREQMGGRLHPIEWLRVSPDRRRSSGDGSFGRAGTTEVDPTIVTTEA